MTTYGNLQGLMSNDPDLYCRYSRGLERLYSLREEKRPKQKPMVIWLCGPTGCGKTRLAMEFPGTRSLIVLNQKCFFDGYHGEDNVILDDLRSNSVPFNYLLMILDRYLNRVEVKGGTTAWNPKRIWITCPRRPEEEFQYRDKYNNGAFTVYEDVGQLTRRCDFILMWDTIHELWIWKKG